MLATLISTRSLADRIRVAYLRRRPWWPGTGPEAAVWSASAATLIQAHRIDRRLPLDPELFVASQPQRRAIADPWGDLTGPEAILRYRHRVSRIVRRLRDELRAELRLIRARARRGLTPERQVALGGRALSPLGRYVAAHRIGRDDLADQLREEAIRQHQSCPLYRLACRGLLPDHCYPAESSKSVGPPPIGAMIGWN